MIYRLATLGAPANEPPFLGIDKTRLEHSPPMTIFRAHLILYIRDQTVSASFFRAVLHAEPTLDVPGMTEFTLPGGAVLGLMPERGIVRLLGDDIDPARAHGAPRAELYLLVDDSDQYHRRALQAGGREVSAPAERDWGHRVAYSLDPDGHVIAFASTPAGAGG
jgi:catechol 2,3-dioxygenase-like lactoylglutathione lyase family enzyme